MFELARTREGRPRSQRFVMPRALKPAARVRSIVAGLTKHDLVAHGTRRTEDAGKYRYRLHSFVSFFHIAAETGITDNRDMRTR